MDKITTSNFTSTTHRDVYPAISPTRPELTQIGKTILITGGGTGIGKTTAKGFILASAATVIIVGRRAEKLKEAIQELKKLVEETNAPTKIIGQTCDVAKSAEVNVLWDGFAAKSIGIDVLVLNAAAFSEGKSLFELGIGEVWYQMEVNTKGPLLFAERFYKQASQGQKFLVNVTTAAIHMLSHPIVAERPAYSLSKASGTLAIQLLANTIAPDTMQIVNFHPGVLYNEGWEKMGIAEDCGIPFDNIDLPAGFAVWASSKEASFLHGRYVWASWDVSELAEGETRARLDEDDAYLRLGMVGMKGIDRG